MAKLLTQAFLRSGTTVRTCWIEARVRIGDRVTLKNSEDPGMLWDVLAAGTPRPADQINHGWDNNI
jgi:hypothetical protein